MVGVNELTGTSALAGQGWWRWVWGALLVVTGLVAGASLTRYGGDRGGVLEGGVACRPAMRHEDKVTVMNVSASSPLPVRLDCPSQTPPPTAHPTSPLPSPSAPTAPLPSVSPALPPSPQPGGGGWRPVCACPDPGDGAACNDPLPPDDELRLVRTPGKGQDLCSRKTYAHPYDYQSEMRRTTAPFLSCEVLREVADHLVDDEQYGCPMPDPAAVACGDIIYTHFGAPLDHFFAHVHPRVRNPYILVSCNSDFNIPDSQARQRILDQASAGGDPILWAWMGQNAFQAFPRVRPINVGLPVPGWKHGHRERASAHYHARWQDAREEVRRKLTAYLAGTWPGDRTVFAAFAVELNRGEREPAKRAAETVGQGLLQVAVEDYPATLKQFVFAIAPAGNGLDVHRMTESVVAGVVPIIRERQYPTLYHDCWPVLHTPQWDAVNHGWLKAAARELLDNLDAVDFRRAYAAFHVARLRREAQRAQGWCARREKGVLHAAVNDTGHP